MLPALLLGALLACESGPDFAEVQKVDTIEAYEKYLVDDPDTFYKGEINKRLDQLYYEKAQGDGTIEAWDAYIAKFPDGEHVKDAKSAKEDLAWDAAVTANTPDAYKKFLTDFPDADKRHKIEANGLVAVADYGHIDIAAPVVAQVNLAEDPKGEMNGWGVTAEVTNSGDKEIEYLGMLVQWIGKDGAVIETNKRALTSKTWQTPATDLEQTTIKPGEKRVWAYTIGFDTIPADQPPTAKVVANGVKFVGDAAPQ